MVWYAWVVIASFVFNALMQVAIIGQPRKPRTPSEAIFAIIELGLYIYVIVLLAT